MKTLVMIEIEHDRAIPALANLVAGRAYTISGVTNAELLRSPSLSTADLEANGFTLAEISLGRSEVVRS